MFGTLTELNLLAVIIATFAYFMLGALWFTPLFGAAYDKALGTKRDSGQKWPAIYYIGPFLSAVVTSAATAVLVYALGVSNLADAVWLGLILGVGFALSISCNNAINPITPRPLLYGIVTGGYHVVGITLVAIIIFLMK